VRVVHVYKDVFPVTGGIENHVRMVCRELSTFPDIDVHILATSLDRRSSVDRLDGVQVVRTGRIATIASTPISPRLPFELRRLQPDIVHLHFPYPVGEVAWLLATAKTPAVITYHSDVLRQRTLLRFYGPILEQVLRRAARILVTSPAYRETSEWLQPVIDRCTVIPLGIDLPRFTDVRHSGDGKTLLFVGRFRYYKGLHYLLEALTLIPDAHLILVGNGFKEAELREQAQRLGLGARVEFATAVSDEELVHFYERADLFVLPACERTEAFGMVLVEATAAALPCVSTELGTGTSYVNLDGVTGLVVPPRNPEALARACRTLLEDPALRARMGKAGRARTQELFSITRVARDVASVYREIWQYRQGNGR